VPEDEREQPQDAHDAGLVRELDPELGEVDLRLLAGGGLETALEGPDPRRPGVAQKIRDDAVAAPSYPRSFSSRSSRLPDRSGQAVMRARR
jgi:hypothetical protein